MKKCNIGGQGVLEGVMMRAPSMCGLAVRKASGEIVYEKQPVTPISKKNKFFGLPIVRGVASFVHRHAGLRRADHHQVGQAL